MFFVLLKSRQMDYDRVIFKIDGLIHCFAPFNYSCILFWFTWHFLPVAPDEIAVYHFAWYASTLLPPCEPSHPIVMLNIFSSASVEFHRACFPKSFSHCGVGLFGVVVISLDVACWLEQLLYLFVTQRFDLMCNDVNSFCIQWSVRYDQHDYDNHLF